MHRVACRHVLVTPDGPKYFPHPNYNFVPQLRDICTQGVYWVIGPGVSLRRLARQMTYNSDERIDHERKQHSN